MDEFSDFVQSPTVGGGEQQQQQQQDENDDFLARERKAMEEAGLGLKDMGIDEEEMFKTNTSALQKPLPGSRQQSTINSPMIETIQRNHTEETNMTQRTSSFSSTKAPNMASPDADMFSTSPQHNNDFGVASPSQNGFVQASESDFGQKSADTKQASDLDRDYEYQQNMLNFPPVSPPTQQSFPVSPIANTQSKLGRQESTMGSRPATGQDTEHARQWRDAQKKRIEDIDAASKKKHDAIIAKARNDIDQFYEEYNNKKAAAIKKNRAAEKDFTSSLPTSPTSEKNIWEFVHGFIENNVPASKDGKTNGKDLSRFKAVLAALKVNAPRTQAL